MKQTLHQNTAARERPLRIKGHWKPVFRHTDFEFTVIDSAIGGAGTATIEISLDKKVVYSCKSMELIEFMESRIHIRARQTFDTNTLSQFLHHLQKEAKIPTPTEMLLDF